MEDLWYLSQIFLNILIRGLTVYWKEMYLIY